MLIASSAFAQTDPNCIEEIEDLEAAIGGLQQEGQVLLAACAEAKGMDIVHGPPVPDACRRLETTQAALADRRQQLVDVEARCADEEICGDTCTNTCGYVIQTNYNDTYGCCPENQKPFSCKCKGVFTKTHWCAGCVDFQTEALRLRALRSSGRIRDK